VMKQKKLEKLAMQLSNHDLAELLNMCNSRLDVYVGCVGKYCIGGEVEFSCPTAVGVQINLKLAELDDLREDRFIAKALDDIATPDNVIEIGGPSDATH
jgi:hypothetical protein